jgi:hypothetical protein
MKSFILIIPLLAVIGNNVLAQPQPLISAEIKHQQAEIRVTRTDEVAIHRTAKIGNFLLKPEESKAVVCLDSVIKRLDINVVPGLGRSATNTGIFMLPELFYARVSGTNDQISYRILFVDSSPLKYDFNIKLFEGSIRFLAIETNYSPGIQTVQKTLSMPEQILVSYGSLSTPLEISNINWPPLDMKITALNPVDSMEVRILTISKPLGYPKNLAVEPAIILSSKRTSIQGFGLQTMPISVALIGISSYKPVSLTIQSSLGTINSSKLVLSDNTPEEVILRSERYGRIDLTAINTTYRSNSISIIAEIPWLFLILALSGGLIGGIARILKDRGKITIKLVAYSCLIGLIVAVAWWGLGIKLFDFSFEDRGYNESMVAGFGLIAGYFL